MPFCNSHYYETFGDKSNPPVILLHGFLGSGSDWSEIVEQLESNYFCLTIDLPGHGRSSDVNEQSYDFSRCTHTTASIADELGLNKFSLVGYSMGGRVALATAINFPDRIENLIIESASPGLKTESERKERIAKDSQLAEKLLDTPFESFLNNWYNQPIFETLKKNKDRFERLKERRQQNNINCLALSLRHMGTGSQPSYWEKLTNLTSQTLLIVGSLDSKFQQIADEMQTLSKNVTKQIITNAGHNTHFEKPNEFINILKNFLK